MSGFYDLSYSLPASVEDAVSIPIPSTQNPASLKISVIICCYSLDRYSDILEAIRSIQRQTLPPYEIIIAVDHTVELFEKLKKGLASNIIVVLNEGVRGLSKTRNAGIRTATGDIIAFIDDDAVAAPDWLAKLIIHYTNPRVIAVGGKALPIWEGGSRPTWFPEEIDWTVGCTHKGPSARTNEVRNMIGCNMSFQKEAFLKAGLFDSHVGRVGKVQGMGEDTEICMRIKHVYPESLILHEPEAIIYHKVPAWRVTWKYLIKRCYNEGLFKNTVRNLSAQLSSASTAPEDSYLRYLLFIAIPIRLIRFYKKGNLSQIFAIMTTITCTGIGNLKGIIKQK